MDLVSKYLNEIDKKAWENEKYAHRNYNKYSRDPHGKLAFLTSNGVCT